MIAPKALLKFALVIVAAVLGVAAGPAGCNTMRGIGEDVAAAGQSFADTADRIASR